MKNTPHNIRPSGPRWRRWLVEGALGVLGLVFGLSLAVHYAVSDVQLTGLVQNALDKALVGQIHVERVHWNWPTGVQLDDVRVRTAEGTPVLTVGHARARIHLGPLVHGAIVVGPILLDGGEVALAQDAKGNLTLAEAFAPRDASSSDSNSATPTVRLEDVRVTHTNVTAVLPGFEAQLRDVTLEEGALRLDAQGLSLDAVITTPHAAASTGAFTLSPAPLRIHIRDGGYALTKQDMAPHVDELTVETTGIAVRAHGELALEDAGFRDAFLGTDISFDTSAPWLAAMLSEDAAQELALGGHLDVTAAMVGDGNHQTMDVHGTGNALRVAGVEVQTLDAALAHEGEAWRAESLAVATDAGRVEAHGFVTPGAHALTVQATALALRRLLTPWVGDAASKMPARVDGEVHVEGASLAPLDTHVGLQADVRNVPVNALPGLPERLQVAAQAHVTPMSIALESLQIDGDGAQVRAHGAVPLVRGGPLTMEAAVDHEAPNTTLEKLQVPVRVGAVQVLVRARGTLERPSIEGDIEARDVEMEGLPRTHLSVPAQFADGVLRVDGALVDNAAMHVVARLQAVLQGADGQWLSAPDCDGEALGSGIDLEKLPGLDMRGVGDLQVRFHGSVLQPRGSASLHLHSIAWRTVHIDEAVALLHGDADGWRIDSMGLKASGGGTAQLTGKLNPRTRAIDASLRVRKLPVAWIGAATGNATPLSGQIKANGTVLGTLDDFKITLDASTPFASSALRASVQPGRKQIDADVRAATTLQDALTMASAPAGAQGDVALSVQAKGPWEAPVVSASLQITDLDVQGSVIGTGHAQVSISTRREAADGNDTPGDLRKRTYDVAVDIAHVLTGRGTVALDHHAIAADAFVQFEELHAADWLPALRLRGIDLFGKGALQAHYNGQRGLRGALHVDTLTAKVEQQQLELAHPVDLEVSQRTLHITDLLLQGAPGRLHVAGHVGTNVDAMADARLDMAFVSALVPALGSASGTLALQLAAHGPLANPKAQGELTIAAPLTVRPRNTLLELRVEEGTIALAHDAVEFHGLKGHMGGGTFNVGGDVLLQNMRPAKYNVHVRGNDLPIHTQDMVVEANIAADAVGEGLLPLIRGRVDIVRGRYLKKFVLKDFNFVSRVPDTSTPLAQRMPELRNLRLDIVTTSLSGMDVKVDAGAFAVQADIETDLHITGSVLAPRIDGKLSASRGTLTFPKASLQLTQAVLDFVPGKSGQPDTSLAVVAEGDVTPTSSSSNPTPQTFSVTLKLDGSLEKMTLDLESNPTLGRLDVLTLLTTGHASLSDLTSGGNNSDSSTLDAALAFAGSQVSGPITAFAQKQLERTLNLRLDLAAEVTQDVVRVTAGKTFNSRLRLEGSYQLGMSADQSTAVSTRAQLSLTDRLLLEGGALRDLTTSSTTPSTGAVQSSLELKWRLVGN